MYKNLFLIVALIGLVATAQYDLTYNLEKGGVYPQNQVVTSNQDQVINGMPQKMTTVITSQSDYKVTDIKDGVYYIDVVMKKLSNETKSDMGGQSMSSDGPDSDPMNMMFINMIKHPIKLTMDKSGDILSFDNTAQMEGLTEGIELPEMQLLQLEAAMAKELSAEKQTANYEQITSIFPDNPVNVGDTWTKKIMVNSIASFEAVNTYKLDSVTDDSYIITYTADVKSPENSSTDFMGMKAAYDLHGPTKGTYTINRKTGWITKGSMDQEIEGDMTIAKSETMPQEMKLTLKAKTNSVIE